MTVAELIQALQAVPNPAVTVVTVDSTVGVNLDTVDTAACISGGIDLEDGGSVDLVGAA